ncbi:hypothetical protein [Mesorhizobium sp. WSM2239]|uniref:Uncharacterized protein n=2 Tax=unclassified Mesorhizobium TaxID=325217 RepID=A0AAU8D2M5_9HYPH
MFDPVGVGAEASGGESIANQLDVRPGGECRQAIDLDISRHSELAQQSDGIAEHLVGECFRLKEVVDRRHGQSLSLSAWMEVGTRRRRARSRAA